MKKATVCGMRGIILPVFLLFLSCYACNGQNKAMEDQKKAFSALDRYTPKGLRPGSNIYMKANINGKPWAATELIPDTDPGSNYHVNGEKDGVRIAFYVRLGNNMSVGYIKNFSDDFAADFMYTDDVVFYGGRSGSYTITKVDDDGFEASFHFTTSSKTGTEKVFQVTDGTLRFPFARKK